MIISKSSPEGNIFAVMSIAKQILEQQGKSEQVKQMIKEVTRQQGYENALKVVRKHVPEISFID